MLTYEQALERVLRATPSGRRCTVALSASHGCVLAKSVAAPCELPRFDNSAVDGYAVNFASRNLSKAFPVVLRVVGGSQAGRPFRGVVREGKAVRIFTGAALPSGASAVVMQEHVTCEGEGQITVHREPQAGQHVRRRGEDIHKGAEVLKAGRVIDAGALGMLAALGVTSVLVHERPRVAILTTGNELRPAGARLAPGCIYDSNGVMLSGLVRESGALPWNLGTAADTLSSITAKIRRGLAADVLVIAGGVSVGDKDLCRAVLARCGVATLFWRVNIKPGMPLFFGRRGRTMVFGLPGNPISVFVTFEEFVKPAIMKLLGRQWQDGYHTPAVLSQELRLSPTRKTHFVRVACSSDNGSTRVLPLDGQGSHHLRSLVDADGWIRVVSEGDAYRAGSRVLLKRRESR